MISRVLLASLEAPTNVGGLAAYQRRLITALKMRGIYVEYVALYSRHRSAPAANEKVECPILVPKRKLLWDILSPCFPRILARSRSFKLLTRAGMLAVPKSGVLDRFAQTDIVHYVGTGWDTFSLVCAAQAKRVRRRFSVLPAVHPASWGDDNVDIKLYQAADAVLCLSENERQHLAQKGVCLSHLYRCILPPMCRPSGNSARFRSYLGLSEEVVVLYLGRRDEGKGYNALLCAWSEVVAQCKRAVLVVGGPGPNVPESISAKRVLDIGIPTEELKADALAACDIFCLPSEHESYGIAYVEAWHYQRPVVCGAAPASRELIEDGVTGLHASRAIGSITTQLCRLISDGAFRRKLGLAGYKKQSLELTEEAMVSMHMHAWAE